MEVRHPSYADPSFVKLLRKHGVALVVADTAGKWPLLEDVTAGFVYVRLHGDQQLYVSGYTPRALARWGARLNAWSEGGQVDDARLAAPGDAPPPRARDVFCYFDNDAKVKAPRDALRLARMLGVDWQPELRTRDLLRRGRTHGGTR
jgi:uncharacterized protein YecE (DUF72 family)